MQDPQPHRRIADALREAIAEGRLHPRAQLPTKRALAAQEDVSEPTVAKAIKQLESEGLVESVPRAGVFVVADPQAVLATSSTALRAELDRVLTRMSAMEEALTGALSRIGALEADRAVQGEPDSPPATNG
jgi:GntR family transcriptional regulator